MKVLQQKHIDAIKKMVDLHWAWDVNGFRYRPKYEPHTGRLILLWNYIGGGMPTHGMYIQLGDKVSDEIWQALWEGWYELYTPIEIKDRRRSACKLSNEK